jgi:hypothetical protein
VLSTGTRAIRPSAIASRPRPGSSVAFAPKRAISRAEKPSETTPIVSGIGSIARPIPTGL